MKLVIVAGLAVTTSLLAVDRKPAERLHEAAAVFAEVSKAHCVENVPVQNALVHCRR